MNNKLASITILSLLLCFFLGSYLGYRQGYRKGYKNGNTDAYFEFDEMKANQIVQFNEIYKEYQDWKKSGEKFPLESSE